MAPGTRSSKPPKLLQVATGCGLVVALVAAGLVAGASSRVPESRTRMYADTVWLSSTTPGLLTLIDGLTAQVAANVAVATPGDGLAVAQLGSAGYVVDTDSSTVVRIDNGTLRRSPPVILPYAKSTVQLLPVGTRLVVVDTSARRVEALDALTLAPVSPILSMPGSDPVVASNGNQIWDVDRADGRLYLLVAAPSWRWMTTVASAPDMEASALTFSAGSPVVVDSGSGRAYQFSSQSRTLQSDIHVPYGSGDLVSGLTGQDGLVVVQPATGQVLTCTPLDPRCAVMGSMSGSGRYGAPVELAGYVYVPDYGAGTVWVLRIDHHSVLETAAVFSPGLAFQLIAHNGSVFVNDPGGPRAGVVSTSAKVRIIDKYLQPSPSAASPRPNPSATPIHSSAPRPSAAPGKSPSPNPSSRQSSPTPSSRPTAPGPAPSSPSTTGQVLFTTKTTDLDLFSVGWSHNGAEIVASGLYLSAVNASTGALLWSNRTCCGDLGYVAWGPSSTRFAATGTTDSWDGPATLRIVSAATGSVLRVMHGPPPRTDLCSGCTDQCVWSSDGHTIATSDDDGDVLVWDAASGQLLQDIKGKGDLDESVLAFSPDGTKLAGGNHYGDLSIWEVGTGKLLKKFAVDPDVVDTVAWAPDGATIATGGADNKAYEWYAATGRRVRTFTGFGTGFEGSSAVTAVSFSPSGSLLAIEAQDQVVRVFNAQTGKLVKLFPGVRAMQGKPEYSGDLSWAPDGTRLAEGTGPYVRVLDMR